MPFERADLDDVLRTGEGQHVEFKQSLMLREEGMHAAVAFANARGGDVFFGIRPTPHEAIGVDLGTKTREDLVNEFEQHIYPSLPIQLETLHLANGKDVVRIRVPADVPPLIGAYLFSKDAIDPQKTVDATRLQAFRRVGPTSQKIDFMVVRHPRPGDQLLVIDTTEIMAGPGFPVSIRGVAWLPEGAGLVHKLDIGLGKPVNSYLFAAKDLPTSDGRRTLEFTLTLPQMPPGGPYSHVWLLAESTDESGCEWRFARRLARKPDNQREWVSTIDVHRRVIRFPPKHHLYEGFGTP